MIPLHENDQVNLLGLDMKVISAWDKNVDLLTRNRCNMGGLMFMLSGKSEKMLFCADLEKDMEQFIIPKHGDELKADYVQLAHHGNWGLSKEFYSLVGAEKGAFADASSSIWDDKTGKYDAPQLKQWFQDRGVPYFSFMTCPNKIRLH